MSRRARTPRHFNRTQQTVVFNNPIRAYTRTVRDVQQKDGVTLGWIRHEHGDWVVELKPEHGGKGFPAWVERSDLSCKDIERDWRELRMPEDPIVASIRVLKVAADDGKPRGAARETWAQGWNDAIDEVLRIIKKELR